MRRIMDVGGEFGDSSAGTNVRDASAAAVCDPERTMQGKPLVRGFPFVSSLFFATLSFLIFALPPLTGVSGNPADRVSILFNRQGIVWSAAGSDLVTALVPWWSFGYRELSHGNLALWNPHNCCGTPFFSNFNPGLLYPPHLLNLILPLQYALNINAWLNVFLAGWLTALWCRGRGVSPLGSVVGGVIFMFSGAYFQHTYGGHEAPMASMALAPLVFLSIDGIFRDRSWHWAMVGAFAVAMQIFAGFPQAVYYTGLVGAISVLLRLTQVTQAQHRSKIILLFAAIYVGGPLMGAVQLFPGFETAGESVRAGGNHPEFDQQCPMPPEDLLQFLGPIFGDAIHADYIGRWFPCEVSLFCGVTTLVLAGYGATFGGSRRALAGTMLLICTLLAISVSVRIGGKQILFNFLYYCVPLFRTFRVLARFNWFMTLFIAMLAAIGFDVVRLKARTSWRPVAIVVGAALFVWLVGTLCHFSVRSGLDGLGGRAVSAMMNSSVHTETPPEAVDNAYVMTAMNYAARQLWFSAATLLAMGGALATLRMSPRFSVLLAAVTIAELFIFANYILTRTPMLRPLPANWAAVMSNLQPDQRLLHPTLDYPNDAMTYGFDDAFGYDPVTLKRFSDFIAATQGIDPDGSNFVSKVERLRYIKLFELLRTRALLFMRPAMDAQRRPIQIPDVYFLDHPMPRLALMQHYEIAPSRDQVISALRDPTFEPSQTVILESAPDPLPDAASASTAASASPGRAMVVRSSTDWLEIEASLSRPAILLITDSYSKYWKVRPIEPGSQSQYKIMPADYTLRAIPLAAGKHHLLLEYKPPAFAIGRWVSGVSMLAWCVLMIRHSPARRGAGDGL